MKRELRLTLKLALTALVITLIDGLYIRTILPYIRRKIKKIQKSDMVIRWYSLVIVYIILIIGLFYFIIAPNRSVAEGAFFGAVVYGIFDFMNHTMFTRYDLPLVMMDMAWGTILCGSTTFIVKTVLK